jgi:iron-sulfur cluster repair protein YtfE (RIC family)
MTKTKTKTHHRRIPWALAPIAAGLTAVVARRARRGHERTVEDDSPADVSFMRAIHAAFRRDLACLEAAAPEVDRLGGASQGVHAGWAAFRDALDHHHTAEDDDLWPVLRPHLTQQHDRQEVDAMVAEHHDIPAALDAVDAALSSGAGASAAVADLATGVRRHLDHEERSVFPLLEANLSRREWRAFLLTERGRRSARERPQWLAWVLDDAGQADAAAVMAELPPPARIVYRWVLRPRYRAQRHWQADAPTTTPADRMRPRPAHT